MMHLSIILLFFLTLYTLLDLNFIFYSSIKKAYYSLLIAY